MRECTGGHFGLGGSAIVFWVCDRLGRREKKVRSVLPGRGIVWAKAEEKSLRLVGRIENSPILQTCSPPTTTFHLINHSPQVRVIPDSCLLAGSSQSLGPDRCCPFHKLSESLVSVPRGYCRYFWTWLLGLSLPSPLSNTFFQHAVREIFPKANSANSILSILSFKSFRSSKSCAQ